MNGPGRKKKKKEHVPPQEKKKRRRCSTGEKVPVLQKRDGRPPRQETRETFYPGKKASIQEKERPASAPLFGKKRKKSAKGGNRESEGTAEKRPESLFHLKRGEDIRKKGGVR